MKVMIYADYYGTCGVRGFLQGPGSQFIEVSRSAKLQQLKEINSCIEGLLEGGATEILVWDNDPGNPDQTPLNVYSLAGKNTMLATSRDYAGPVARVDASFDAAIHLGAYAMNHTPCAFMAHTMNAQSYDWIQLNGNFIGDLGLNILRNAYFHVPTILVSGDDKACAEAVEFNGQPLETVITKKGLSRHKSMNYSAVEVCAEIREKSKKALQNLASFKVKNLPGTYELRVKMLSQNYAGGLLQSGVEMVDDTTGILRSDDLLDMIAQLYSWAPGVHAKRFKLTPETKDFFCMASLD